VYRSDVIIFPDRVESNWWRQEGHSLSPQDLTTVVNSQPEIVILGQGSPGLMKVPASTRRYLLEHDIEVHVSPTPAAVALFNRCSSHSKTVAALHLTC
jgi:hypothetical protein